MRSNQTTTSSSTNNNNNVHDNSTSIVIDFNDEGSLKRALVRTLGTAEALKPNVTRDVYEMWRDRIFDVIRQCKMETMTKDGNDGDVEEYNALLERTISNRLALSNAEIQTLNKARACYSFMRDQIESQLMISIKNIHVKNYSQHGSLKPQFLHIASGVPGMSPIGRVQTGHGCIRNFRLFSTASLLDSLSKLSIEF